MRINGCAVVFNQPSQGLPFVEYIEPHALDGVDLSKVFLLYAHDYQNVLARTEANTLTLDLNEKGLFFSAQLADTSLAHDVFNDIEAGNVQGVSFGFDIPTGGDSWDVDYNTGQTIHYVNQIDTVDEVSLTPIPAFAQTSVSVQRDLQQFKQGGKAKQMNSDELLSAVKGLEKALNDMKAGSANSDKKAEDKPEDKAKPDEKRAEDKPTTTPTTTKAPVVTPTTTKAPTVTPTTTKAPATREAPKPDDGKDPDDNLEPNATKDVHSNKDDKQKRDDDSSDDSEDRDTQQTHKGDSPMAKSITEPNKKDLQKRSFENYLKTGKITRDASAPADGGLKLENGQVIIPQDILKVEKEQYQFPRLSALIRTVSVHHTTGKLPVIDVADGALAEHTEYDASGKATMPAIKPINWDLKSYTGKYVFSQELILDSDYNWESELATSLFDIRDNTDDSLIAKALTDGITVSQEDDLVAGIKKALNVNLKPKDSQQASIIATQSAYNQLDLMKDGMGRPLIQPDVTKGTGYQLLGKTLVVVDDELFGEAGEATVVVAPLQKAVINFKQSEISGKFVDSYDIWYKTLGIFLREDVVQARADLITVIKASSVKPTTTTTTTASK